ncbi:MAG: short-chain-enoyl-CoA hydratase [Bacteroidales bacterium]|jgi:enoyl-CoA hydratase|nr:short-chain-enoyl-CoA hydratase [Bacteroidales bacterium]MCI1733600.1 short-chain-enoyl-CoA hydratase [Bacteroidales bacterium]
MNYTKLIVEVKDKICTVKINNPEAMNALNSTILSELDAAFTEIAANDGVSVVVITGEGRAFVAGADISQMSTMNATEGKAFGVQGSAVFRKIENLDKPVIAAINGFALGGGCELAMACDIRIASNKAKIGQPETGLGITPGFSGTQRLPRIVGLGKAKEIIYTAKPITADEAYRIGLVNKVVEPEALMNEAYAMAAQIAKNAPIALKYSKEAINKGMQTDIDSAIALENDLFALCFSTEDQKEGMKAFFEKRPAEWKKK